MRAKAEQERAKLPKITSLFQQAAKIDSNVTADASAVSSPPDPATASNPPVSSESRQTDSPAAPLQPSELAVPHASRQVPSFLPPFASRCSGPPFITLHLEMIVANVNRQEAQGNGGWGVDGQTEKVCHHWGLDFRGREQASPQAKTVARPLPEAYKWSTSGNICLSACCCPGRGTSRPPPPATPPGAMGDGAAEPAPSPRRSPLTLSMFSKPRFGGASGASAKPNLVVRKQPVEPPSSPTMACVRTTTQPPTSPTMACARTTTIYSIRCETCLDDGCTNVTNVLRSENGNDNKVWSGKNDFPECTFSPTPETWYHVCKKNNFHGDQRYSGRCNLQI
ncbi:hypothetical protein SKAU_G00410540 [Synaphobranchus kaupii]|uniref:Uncharacterized protein n=1 Tax=Synaphobranchus kaupii TaxID=118154 RepID=A0A9Q1IAW8_SYNKA|nr:hypothetical protein SKAU_G00410540 [Synaphobranchus kaupii]